MGFAVEQSIDLQLKTVEQLHPFSLSFRQAAQIKDNLELPEYYKRPAKILHNICLAESGAMESKLKQCMDGVLHDDREVKCYIHCLFDKVDVIDEATGQILLDRLAPLAPDNDVKDVFNHLTRECGHISKF